MADEYSVDTKALRELLLAQRQTGMKGGIYHATQIDLAYNSNRIEGSQLSHEQTRYIFETQTVDGVALVDDIIETSNHFRLFDHMLDNLDAPLSGEKLKGYHRILKSGTSDARQDWFAVGDWKRLGNTVGSNETTAPEKVDAAVGELLQAYPHGRPMGFEDIVEFHWRLERIHPFQDGNGRVGRMVMFEQCLQNGILPFIVLDRDKFYYYRGLQEYGSEPGYLRDSCRSWQDHYFATYRSLFADGAGDKAGG